MLTNFAGTVPVKAEHPRAGIPPAMYSVRFRELESWVLMPARQALTLAELEALSSALLAVFLAFPHARIASEKSIISESMAQIRIQNRKRPRKPHAHRSGLSSNAAAIACGHNVQFIRRIGELQGLDGAHQPCDILEISIHSPAIDLKFAAARADEDARYGVFAPACAISLGL
jgi:hypothetical protein